MSYWGNSCDYNCPECLFSKECVQETQSEEQRQACISMMFDEKLHKSGLSLQTVPVIVLAK